MTVCFVFQKSPKETIVEEQELEFLGVEEEDEEEKADSIGDKPNSECTYTTASSAVPCL